MILAIYYLLQFFSKAYGMTVLLGCFDLFIDLVLQVPGFCLLAITNALALKEFLDLVKS